MSDEPSRDEPSRDDDHPSDRVLAAWGELSARSRPRAVVRRDGVQAGRPPAGRVGAGGLATLAVAVVAVVAAVAVIGRTPGPVASGLPASGGASVTAVGPSQADPTTVLASPSPSIAPSRQPGRDVQAGALITVLDGWALSNGSLVVTHDGGTSWAPTAQPGPGERIVGVAFADALHGWLGSETYPAQGDRGELVVNIHRTDDGGATWETVELARVPSPGPDPTVGFPTFSVLSADRVFVMLALPDAPGYVSRLYTTGDGGRTWERRAGVTESQRFTFIDEAHGWAIRGDRGTLVRTVDGGHSWQRAPIPTAQGADLSGYYPTFPIRAADHQLVTALVSGRDGDPVLIATSSDTGSTWSVARPAPAGSFGSIAVLGDGSWFLSGRPPQVSPDGGATWEPVAAAPLDGIGGVTVAGGSHLSTLVARPDCPPNMDCYVPAELWISDDAGLTWRNVTP